MSRAPIPKKRRRQGLDRARRARGVAVIIDVFRAFSLVPWALARGARRVVSVATLEEAIALRLVASAPAIHVPR